MMNGTLNSGMSPALPDSQPLTAGRGLLSATRNDLTRDIDGQIIDARSVLERAQYALRSDADLVIADAQGAIEGAKKQLEQRVINVLSNAGVVAMEHGIDLPPISEIRTRSSFPPPSAIQSAPGNSPQPPISAPTSYGPVDITVTVPPTPVITIEPPSGPGSDVVRCVCDVHKFPDEFTREQFRFVYRKIDGKYYVCDRPIESVTDLQVYFPFYIALNWWQAELICHLMNDCQWSVELFQTYEACIRHVQLFHSNAGVNMGGLCQNAPTALAALCKELQV